MAINIKISGSNKQVSITGIYKIKDGILRSINNVYNGTKLVWTAIKEALSAFGAGFWRNDKPWSNEDSWKNE